jgi:hypothetical protein
LVLRLEVLDDRVAALEKIALKSAEWVPWLFSLFKWLRRTFVDSPSWVAGSSVQPQTMAVDAERDVANSPSCAAIDILRS